MEFWILIMCRTRIEMHVLEKKKKWLDLWTNHWFQSRLVSTGPAAGLIFITGIRIEESGSIYVWNWNW